ncbi:hypothetical protein ACTPEM_26740, partial [Clostridioides difficile]
EYKALKKEFTSVIVPRVDLEFPPSLLWSMIIGVDKFSIQSALYSRFGSEYIGNANMFSFNNIDGMCPHCHGLGKKLVPNMNQ